MRSHSDFARKRRNALEVKGQHPRTSQAENALKGAPMLVFDIVLLVQKIESPARQGFRLQATGSKAKLSRA